MAHLLRALESENKLCTGYGACQNGQLRLDVREIIGTLCKYKGVEIIEGAVCADHVHICVSIPPKISVSNFMGYLKGKSTLMIYDRHPEQSEESRKEENER